MANFVKYTPHNGSHEAKSISHTIQHVGMGGVFHFGVYGADGLKVGPNDPSFGACYRLPPIRGATNNITWFGITPKHAGNVLVDIINPNDNAAWDTFQLAVTEAALVKRLKSHLFKDVEELQRCAMDDRRKIDAGSGGQAKMMIQYFLLSRGYFFQAGQEACKLGTPPQLDETAMEGWMSSVAEEMKSKSWGAVTQQTIRFFQKTEKLHVSILADVGVKTIIRMDEIVLNPDGPKPHPHPHKKSHVAASAPLDLKHVAMAGTQVADRIMSNLFTV